VLRAADDAAAAERYMTARLRPFYAQGQGSAVCSVCILVENSRHLEADVHTRRDYIQHFSTVHHPQLPFIGLSFPTQYNSRLAQAYALYILCCAGIAASPILPNGQENPDLIDKPEEAPFAAIDDEAFGITYSGHLADFMTSQGYPHIAGTGPPTFGYEGPSDPPPRVIIDQRNPNASDN